VVENQVLNSIIQTFPNFVKRLLRSNLSVVIRVSELLRQYIENRSAVEVKGRTVKECLADLVNKYPALNNQIFDKNGTVLVLVSHDHEIISKANLDKKIEDGSEIDLTLIIAGG
jgi:molybdopterin converting factor small subunit